ncbi:MAG: hypothetical protein IH991_16385 [Planctomycetes bacterium]|nr:hypothetical protein [Planctomycetota bacterium]
MRNANQLPTGAYVAIRVPAGRKIEGRLVLPDTSNEKLTAHRFSIPVSHGKPEHKKSFLSVKRAHYLHLLNRDIPGAAWFRHQVRTINKELGIQSENVFRQRRFFGTSRSSNFEDTYALISGGRAVSENLQLDRVLPEADVKPETVPLSSLKGITVREFDWQPLVKDIDPKLDALATLIPSDQHALFFPSFSALVDLAETSQEQGAPILSFAEPKSESANVHARYERQLCLSLGSAAKLLGPQVIKSVAFTGGDPYLRTGADVAVIFEPRTDAEALQRIIAAQVTLAAARAPAARPVEGKIGNVAYAGRRARDRSICSYVAKVGGAVVVTNSVAQLKRIVETASDPKSSLAALDEYRFFRHRYPLGDEDETSLLVISDATIRRWCGPKWRIGTSRRTRAVALMTQMQAEQLDALVGRKVQTMEVEPPKTLPDAGKFLINTDGVGSTVYGTLEFQTPIIELEIDLVTSQEASFYRRWRDGYQRNWSNFFDPIAVRFFVGKEKLAADVTVMPLIDSSQYNEWAELSRGATIKPVASDPHGEAIVQWTIAINAKTLFDNWGALLQGMIRVNPFGWLGETVTVYVDKDPFWLKMAQAEDEQEFVQENLHQLPIAIHAEVKNGFMLAAFLTGVRAFIEQTAPDMTEWKTKRHNGQAYVRVGLSETGRAQSPNGLNNLAIYYAATGDGFTLTLNEDLLKRALDRRVARREAATKGEPVKRPARRLLGKSLCVQADKSLLELIKAGFAGQYQDAMRQRAWSNLPILNEWKQRYADRDPVALHAQFWQRKLICPGGGKYQWNEKWQTIESTVYGHPAEPKDGPPLPLALQGLVFGNFGITFEENGLRARVELEQERQSRQSD